MIERPPDRADTGHGRTPGDEPGRVVRMLSQAGFLAPAAEADALLEASSEGAGSIDELIARRLRGEPLAWITGSVIFCGVRVLVDPGVFVPRPQSERLARRAAALLPPEGVAVDLCTGSGAVPVVLGSAHPRAALFGTDVDPVAVDCARRNGVDAAVGDLDAPIPPSLRERIDVLTAVVPYVPTEALHLLPSDTVANEPLRALDGGPGGTRLLMRTAEAATRWLRPGGVVLLELGGDQAREISIALADLGFTDVLVHRDDEGQDRAIEARFG